MIKQVPSNAAVISAGLVLGVFFLALPIACFIGWHQAGPIGLFAAIGIWAIPAYITSAVHQHLLKHTQPQFSIED